MCLLPRYFRFFILEIWFPLNFWFAQGSHPYRPTWYKLNERAVLFHLKEYCYSKWNFSDLLKRNINNISFFLATPFFSPHFLPTVRTRVHVVTFQSIFNSYFIKRFLHGTNKKGVYIYLGYCILCLHGLLSKSLLFNLIWSLINISVSYESPNIFHRRAHTWTKRRKTSS